MTKSAFAVLIMVMLSFVLLVAWYFIPPSTNLLDFGSKRDVSTAHEPPKTGVPDLGTSSSRGKRTALAESTDSGRNSPEKSTTLPSRPVTSTPTPVQLPQIKRQDAASQSDELFEGPGILGLVRDENGHPLSNVKVLAEPIQQSAASASVADPGIESVRSVRTGYDGSFYFENLADGDYWIRVAPISGFAPAETTARPGETTVSLVLARLRDVRIYGFVNDKAGTPLDDVQIIGGLPARATKTGPEGDYQLDISVRGISRHSFHFRREGYREKSVWVEPADLEDLLDFQLDVSLERLEGLTTVTGRLEDSDGRLIAGKVVILRSTGLKTSYDVRSNVKGQFAMKGVEPGSNYELSVRPGGDYKNYKRARLEVPTDGLELDVVLESLGQGELSGWMTDVDGKRIPGVALTLQSKVSAGASVQVVGDNTGFFTVDGFPEGNAVLKTNSFPIFEIYGIRASYEAEEPIFVVLDIGRNALQGRVTNVFGEPLAALGINLGWKHVENGVQNTSARKTSADQSGNFAFTGLGSGVHTLRVYAPGYRATEVEIDVSQNPDDIVIELEEES